MERRYVQVRTVELQWRNTAKQKEFFDKLSIQLGHKNMEDWYTVTQEDIYRNGGNVFLKEYYNGSPSKALQTIYPSHKWMLWRFGNVQRGYWNNPLTHKPFF